MPERYNVTAEQALDEMISLFRYLPTETCETYLAELNSAETTAITFPLSELEDENKLWLYVCLYLVPTQHFRVLGRISTQRLRTFKQSVEEDSGVVTVEIPLDKLQP